MYRTIFQMSKGIGYNHKMSKRLSLSFIFLIDCCVCCSKPRAFITFYAFNKNRL